VMASRNRAAVKLFQEPRCGCGACLLRTVHATFECAGGRAFFDWLVDLPWKRVGVWGFVAMFAYQLKDFFGVSPPISLICKKANAKQCFLERSLSCHSLLFSPVDAVHSESSIAFHFQLAGLCSSPFTRVSKATDSLPL
jgi:hypothetical protein